MIELVLIFFILTGAVYLVGKIFAFIRFSLKGPHKRPGGYGGPEAWQTKDRSTEVFSYAFEPLEVPEWAVSDLPFAVIDFETTGVEAGKNRVIEISVIQFDKEGNRENSFLTLINPGRQIRGTDIHGIRSRDVQDAPAMKEVLPYVCSLLSGRIVVAHNAPFEESFLASEAKRNGIKLSALICVDTLSLARKFLTLPNHKLVTLCEHFEIQLDRAHSAEADVLATASLFLELRKLCPLTAFKVPHQTSIGSTAAPPRSKHRTLRLKKGPDGFMSDLWSHLPWSGKELEDQSAEVYIDLLERMLSDAKLSQDEADSLVKCALELGLTKSQLDALNLRFLEAARTAAMADDVLTVAELKELKILAKELGRPGFFDTLQVTKTARSARKCGICRVEGHMRSQCPQNQSRIEANAT